MDSFERLFSIMLDRDVYPNFLDSEPEDAELQRAIDEACEQCSAEIGILSEGAIEDLLGSLDEYWAWELRTQFSDFTQDEARSALVLEIVRNRMSRLYADPRRWMSRDVKGSKVFSKYPELLGLLDDDGLVPFGPPFEIDSHGLAYRDSDLYYHQFLRRHFSSNINYDFIEALRRASAVNPRVRIRIALDPHRVTVRGTRRRLEERDRWFGPPLAWSRLDDMSAIGRTVHGDASDHLWAGISRTEFVWARHGENLKAFQAEELPPLEAGEGYVFCRYVHSLRDTGRRLFVHLDGAVRVYTDDYPQRYDGTIEYSKGHYVKLFRVDGELPTGQWSMLVSFFFRQNRLVLEYLQKEPSLA
ncbi:MAG TPA: hypothetical protein GXX23_05180 [Firmicutes bacterium]|nr:hypothetical protein [Candidatus Fermentithermobacillaceae bacterium]